MKFSLGVSNFLEEISSLPPLCCFPLFLCIDHRGRLSYLSLLFFGTLHSDAYIFPFLIYFFLLFFSQLFVRPPQTAILLFCIYLFTFVNSPISLSCLYCKLLYYLKLENYKIFLFHKMCNKLLGNILTDNFFFILLVCIQYMIITFQI